jgi:hypothetical protein
MGSGSVEQMHGRVNAWRTLRNAFLAAVVLLMANPAQGAFIGLGYWNQDFLYSPDGTTWSAPLADAGWNTYYDVVWGTEWVAVGSSGSIQTSPDGRTWTQQATGTWWNFNSVDYGVVGGSPLYAAVGPMLYMGTVPFTGVSVYAQEVYTSPNGVTWTATNTPITTDEPWQYQLRGIAHGMPGGTGTFVAVDGAGEVLISSDGVSWTPTVVANPAGGNIGLNAVEWGVDKYVAVGDSGRILTSADGVAWVPRTSGTGARLLDVTFDAGTSRWMAVGDTAILTSPDGIAWSPVSTPVQPMWNGWQGVTRGNGLWVVVATERVSWSQSYAAVITSPDGLTWTQRIANSGWGGFEAVEYANGQFLAVGYPFALSDDGKDWGPGNTAALGNAIDVAYNGATWVMVPSSQGTFLTSPDGVNWRFRDTGQSWVYPTAVSWGANQWVVVGYSGLAMTSPDGLQWTRQTVSTSAWPSFLDVAFRAGQWVAVGYSGQVYTSPDAVTWTKRTSGTSNALRDVVWGGDTWVAVGDGGVILTSEDGQTWTKRTSGTTDSLGALEYDGAATGDKFAAMPWTCCSSSDVLSSADGITWTRRDTGMFASGGGMMGGLAKDGSNWAALPYFGWPTVEARHTNDVAGTWASAALPGYPYITGLNSDRLQPLHCLPETQIVGLNETARIDGGGGRWPYTWEAPQSSDPSIVTGVTYIERSYASENFYYVMLSDATGASVECEVHAMKNPPPPPPPPPGPLPRCGYSITTTVPGMPDTYHDPDLYDWQELDPAQGGDGKPMKWQYRAWWWGNQLVDAPWASPWFPYPVKDDTEPFNFEFCGSKYNTIVLSAQGVACFENTDESIESDVFPWWGLTSNCYGGWAQHLPTQNTWTAHPAVFGLAGYHNPYDWSGAAGCPNNDPSTCLFYKVEGSAPNRVLIFEESQVPTGWGCPSWAWWCTPGPLAQQTFQIKLHESSGCVEVHYKHIESNTNDLGMNYPMVAGFQNEDATLGYEHFYHDYYWWDPEGYPWTHEKEAWRACPFGAVPDRPKFNEDQGERAFDVTKNDNGAGEAFSIVAWTNTTRGKLTRGPGAGEFTYKPVLDDAGYDTFSYTILSASGRTSTGIVNITLNAVNDEPRFEYTKDRVVFDPRSDEVTIPGFAHLLQPGPATAVDEATQGITFRVGPNSNPMIFADGPAMERTMGAESVLPSGPLFGDHAMLRFTPSGATGKALVCMQAVDTGGNATVTNSWGESVQSDDVGERCIDMVANAPPVAYFEPSSPTAAPGVRVTMVPCPRPAPDCTHDPDGAIARWLWEFGDGTTSEAESPSHAFRGPGSFRVKLTVWDEYGAMASTVRTVLVEWPEAAPVGDDGGSDAPVADAGPDRTVVEGTHVQLQGLQVGGGLGAVPAWSQLAGIPVGLAEPGTLSPSFTAPFLPTMDPVDLVFGLRLSQGAATGESDYVVVRVVSANRAPVADAGETLTVEPGARVLLDASASSDPDGTPLAYRWEQVLVPGTMLVALEDGANVQARFTAPGEATSLVFRLRVEDGKAGAEDLVTVHVRPAPAPAVAKAREPVPDALPHSSAAAVEARQWAALAWAGAGFLLVALAAAAFALRRSRR